jgi:hypothetical protein
MEGLRIVYKLPDPNYFSISLQNLSEEWHRLRTVVDPMGRAIASNSSPGVVMFNEWLYLVYRGHTDDDLRIAWRNIWQEDLVRWEGNIKIRFMPGGIVPKSNSSPNLAVFGNMLYTVHRGSNSDSLFMARFDGATWHGSQLIRARNIELRSSHNPGICAYKGRLHIVYRAWSGDVLYHASSLDGESWVGDAPIVVSRFPLQSTRSPCLCVFKGTLYAVYKAWNSNDLYMADFDGTSWLGQQKIDIAGITPQSDHTPGMAVFLDRLCLVYKSGSSTSLLGASFDGKTWSGNDPIGGNMPYRPQSNEGPNICTVPPALIERSGWMSLLDASMCIGDINLPGTHDSAAINTLMKTPYATQDHSISAQLKSGVRLLDVRLKVKKAGNEFIFVTCHGTVGSLGGANEYQSLESLLEECREFLGANKREAIVMLLQVDDWSDGWPNTGFDLDAKLNALRDLRALLEFYPTIGNAHILPELSAIRGKILLINRISDFIDGANGGDLGLGTPFPWVGNTPGALIQRSEGKREYDFWLQDQFAQLPHPPEKSKTGLVILAFRQYISGQLVLNFASATKALLGESLLGVYVNDRILNFFGETPGTQRIRNFGWLFLDYAFEEFETGKAGYGKVDLVDLIVDSNFGYSRYSRSFRVEGV